MERKKNDIVTITITDMNHDGEGIGKLDGYTLFIKDSVIGDTIEAKLIKVKKTYGYARLEKIIEPSPYRINAECKVARQCGGCQLQTFSYDAQLRYKENKVKSCIERIGGIQNYTLEPIIGMEQRFHYRNKAQYPVGRNKEGRIIIGFYAGRTHSIIETETCLLGMGEDHKILTIIKQFMEQYKINPYDEKSQQGLIRHILIRRSYHTGQIMVCLVINGQKLPHSNILIKKLREIKEISSIMINQNEENTNRIMGNKAEVLWGEGYIIDTIGEIKFQISPLSFFQVNPIQTQKLYDKVLQYAQLTGEETVWDLYCGIGTISLFLAQKARKVYGVEIVPDAVKDAKENAKQNKIENVEFLLGKAEEIVPKWFEEHQEKADIIVLDPPRKGCDIELLNTIEKMHPKRIIYVSCDPATLARDLKILDEKGYQTQKVQPIDLFGETVHCEVCVELCRKGENK